MPRHRPRMTRREVRQNVRCPGPRKTAFRSGFALWLLAGLSAMGALADSRPAAAQGKVEAKYEASLAGIPVGRGTWAIDITEINTARRRPAAPRGC